MTATQFQAQKDTARQLDELAARAEVVGSEPATQKQCWFLAGLLIAAGETVASWTNTNTSFVLTKKRASRSIDFFLQNSTN